MRLTRAKSAKLGDVVWVSGGRAFYRCTITDVQELMPGRLQTIGPFFEVTREGHAKPLGTRTLAGLFVEATE